MYSYVIFTSPSVKYDKETKIVSVMADNSMFTNHIIETDEAPWAGAFLGKNGDSDLKANVNLCTTECHIIQVIFLYKSSLGEMTGRLSQPQKNDCSFFTTNPSVIDLGLNFNGNISASAGCCHGVIPNHLAKFWRIGVEASKKTQEITTQLRKHKIDGPPLTRNV